MKLQSLKFAVLIGIIALVSACTSSKTLNLVRGINDVSIAVINANQIQPPNNLSDAAAAQILTINKQLLDIIKANPQGLHDQLVTVVTNARQALPQPVDAKIMQYLTTLDSLIMEIK